MKNLLLATALMVGSIVSNANADIEYRGFQVGYVGFDEAQMAKLVNEWNVNLVRIQVGNNSQMDGTTGAAYYQMMLEQLDMVDKVMPIFAKYNVKVVFALYSPPGGFHTRTAPAHYEMFVNPLLQAEYIQTWQLLINKYYVNSPYKSLIYAFDLLNEPALNPSLLCQSCPDWNSLVSATVAGIRQVSADAPLMIKSLYGDPSQLAKLEPINDSNIIYSYHAYPFNEYQHSGIGSTPVDVKRPTFKQISNRLDSSLVKFFNKVKVAYDKGLVPSYPPRLNVGEFAVSSCATDNPAQFFADLLGVIEGDATSSKVSKIKQKSELTSTDKKKKRRKSAKERRREKRERAKKKRELERKRKEEEKKRKQEEKKDGGDKKDERNDPKDQIVHESWTNHAWADAYVWDPRYVCNNGDFTEVVGQDTDRGLVLKEFFARNN
jgi:hypothetical protein